MAKYRGMEVHPDALAAIKMVNQMASYVAKKYHISTREARELISEASTYNVSNKKEAYEVIDSLYRESHIVHRR
jgi:hypothetical protein